MTGRILTNNNYLFHSSIISGESIASEFRDEIIRRSLEGFQEFLQPNEIALGIRQLGFDLVPLFAESFFKSDLAAWLSAYDFNARKLPGWLLTHLRETQFPPPGRIILTGFEFLEPDRVFFPIIRNAARSLMARAVMTRDEFDEIADEAKQRAFTIAGKLTEETVEQVRDTLVDLTLKGPTLPQFQKAIEERVQTCKFGRGHLETVYRTNLQAAYRDGREALVENPIVGSVFPYQEYIPIMDARARPEHKALAKLGLNGTGVYRRDDPFWDQFTPPWDYNCRCAVNLLTLEKAAAKGVQEAQEWIKTGVAPQQPEYRIGKIPFLPNPGFGQRSGRLIAA